VPSSGSPPCPATLPNPGAPSARPRVRDLARDAAPAPLRRGQSPALDPHRPRPEHHRGGSQAPGLARRTRDRPSRLPSGRHRPMAGYQPRRLQRQRLGPPAAGTAPSRYPRTQRRDRTAITGDRRWERPLDDSTLYPVDRAAGCLVLLYGQPASRIAALTASHRNGCPGQPPARPIAPERLAETAQHHRHPAHRREPHRTHRAGPPRCPPSRCPPAASDPARDHRQMEAPGRCRAEPVRSRASPRTQSRTRGK
jgi:hypothetical protein